MSTLTQSQAREFAECEAAIERGLQSIAEMGNALRKVRDNKWYRETHATFAAYCRERWNMSKSYVNDIIRSAKVIENLTAMAVKPDSERQARPLSQLEPEQQRAAWSRATETAGNEHPTAAQVKAAVEEIAPKERTSQQETADAVAMFIKHDEEMNLWWVSFDRHGGVDKLTRYMDNEKILYWIEVLEHYVERSQEVINQLREKLG